MPKPTTSSEVPESAAERRARILNAPLRDLGHIIDAGRVPPRQGPDLSGPIIVPSRQAQPGEPEVPPEIDQAALADLMPGLPGLMGAAMAVNPAVLVDGLSGLVVLALDAAAARLTDEDEARPQRLDLEATDRDLIWGAATLTQMLGDDAPSALRLWAVQHAAIIEAVRISVEAAGETDGAIAPVRAHAYEAPASIDGEALVEALLPLLDTSRHSEGPDGSVLIAMKPWELEAIDAAIAPALAIVAPEAMEAEPVAEADTSSLDRFVAVRWTLPGIKGGSVEIYDRENPSDVEAWDKNAAIGYPQQVIGWSSDRQACEALVNHVAFTVPAEEA